MLSSLSVIVPAYNEADRIGATIRRVISGCRELGLDFEIIVVSDGSVDATVNVVGKMQTEFPGLINLISIPHFGKGKAVQTGIFAAAKDWVLFMDADNSVDISSVRNFIPFTDFFSVLVGSRAIESNGVKRVEKGYRHFIGKQYNILVRRILGVKIYDTQCGFKLLRKEEARKLFALVKETGFAFDSELLFLAAKHNLPVKEVPVDWVMSARSSIKIARDSWRMFCSLWRIRWRNLPKSTVTSIYAWSFLGIILMSIFTYRATVLNFSLPNGTIFGHTRSYFQDEDAAVADTARLIAAVKKNPINIFDPGPTVYPVFSGIISSVPLGVIYLAKYRDLDVAKIMTASPQDQAVFYSLIAFAGRLVSFLSAFASIILFIIIGRELKIPKRYLAFLAIVYAFLPTDILLSIEAKSNSLMNFILLLTLYLSLRWLRVRHDKLLLAAATLSGMAMGTRLNGILGASIVFFAVAWTYRGRVDKFFMENKKRFYIFAMPFLGLLVSSPHLLAHPAYIARMWSRAGSGSLVYSLHMAWSNIFHTLKFMSGGYIGFALFIIALAYAIIKLARGTAPERVLASWFFLYLLVFMQTSVPIIRYAYPLLPLWLLLLGLAMHGLKNWTRRVGAGIMCLWAGSAILFGVAYMQMLRLPPLQHEVNNYVENSIVPGYSIGTYFNEEFYSREPIDYRKYKIFACRDLEEGIRTLDGFATRPEYLVVPWRGVDCMSKVFEIEKYYEKVKEFSRAVRFGPFVFDVNGAGAYRPTPVIVYKYKR